MNKESVCSVMTLYHPTIETADCIDRTLLEVAHLYLVDNTGGLKEEDWLVKRVETERITYIKNNHNVGVAKALNLGLDKAQLKGYNFVLLMDQDTQVFSGAVNELMSIYGSANKSVRICMVGSAHQEGSKQPSDMGSYKIVDTVITSGALLSMSAYTKLGGFNEAYFIDQVDHEYCLRAIDNGYRNIISIEKLMEHSIGEPVTFSVFGLHLKTTNHSALRRYYFSRNIIFLIKGYFFSHPVLTFSGLINLSKIMVFIVLFEADKINKLRHVFLGLKDGLLNFYGKRIEK